MFKVKTLVFYAYLGFRYWSLGFPILQAGQIAV